MVTRRIIVDDDEGVTPAPTNGSATTLSSMDDLNAANVDVVANAPYIANVKIVGTSDLLFHRWQDVAVAEKAAAAKGSRAKKSDNVESYVWRDENGVICLPGEYLRGSITDPKNGAAKYRQDPRSPRKSALDLFKASIVALTNLAVITTVTGDQAKTWDYVDSRRVTVQRNGITRQRPAFNAGWRAEIQLQCLQPNYVPPQLLLEVLGDAGRLVGVADFRPTFGRFAVTGFDIQE